jgi:hypothetical protein
VLSAGRSSLSRQALTIALLACLLAGCFSRGASYKPAMYPHSGFGRVGCFAGPSLSRFQDAAGVPTPEAIAHGPWLVLDSLVARDTAWRRSGEPASIVMRRDSLLVYDADWRRVPGDSISITEYTYPSVNWRLHLDGQQLSGEGILVSDLVVNGEQRVYRWPVTFPAVPCASVPLPPARRNLPDGPAAGKGAGYLP